MKMFKTTGRLFLVCLYWKIECSLGFGIYDQVICEAQESASCAHQLSPQTPSSSCLVKYINRKECPSYSVAKVFDPMELPFQLTHYIDNTMKTVALNLTMSLEDALMYYMHFENLIDRSQHMCRSFSFSSEALLYGKSISWDCLMFDVAIFEGGEFQLEFSTHRRFGGRYSFKVPMASSQTRSVSSYEPFFFLHNHLLTTTGKLYVTIQAVPFPVSSYTVLVVSCMSQDTCREFVPIQSFAIRPSSFIAGIGGVGFHTLDLGFLVDGGRYSVAVQVKSFDCDPNCAISFSPIIVIEEDTGQYILGILLIFIFISASLSVAVIYKMRKSHLAWVEKIQKSPVSVLFVYHAENLAVYTYLLVLADFLEKKCHIQVFLIDRDSGGQNPSQWTEKQLQSVKCVLFFCPEDEKAESVMPIRNQYAHATALLEAQIAQINFFKCCQIISPWSFPVKSKVVQSLKSFTLQDDFAHFLNWVHQNSFVKLIFYWRPLAKEWHEHLRLTPTHTGDESVKLNFEEAHIKLKETFPLTNKDNDIDDAFDEDIKNVSEMC